MSTVPRLRNTTPPWSTSSEVTEWSYGFRLRKKVRRQRATESSLIISTPPHWRFVCDAPRFCWSQFPLWGYKSGSAHYSLMGRHLFLYRQWAITCFYIFKWLINNTLCMWKLYKIYISMQHSYVHLFMYHSWLLLQSVCKIYLASKA